jgi:hypothetical protein
LKRIIKFISNKLRIKKSFYDDLHFKLGRIVVNYNLIESNIIGLICNLSNYNDITVGFKLCTRKSASQLLILLNKLIKSKIKDKNVLTQFDTLYSHIKEVIEIRNGFIHSIYVNSTDREAKLSPKIKRVSQIKIREFEKGKKTVNSGLIVGLEGMENFVNILNDVYEESNNFFGELSRVTPLRQIIYSFPDESEVIKKEN